MVYINIIWAGTYGRWRLAAHCGLSCFLQLGFCQELWLHARAQLSTYGSIWCLGASSKREMPRKVGMLKLREGWNEPTNWLRSILVLIKEGHHKAAAMAMRIEFLLPVPFVSFRMASQKQDCVLLILDDALGRTSDGKIDHFGGSIVWLMAGSHIHKESYRALRKWRPCVNVLKVIKHLPGESEVASQNC